MSTIKIIFISIGVFLFSLFNSSAKSDLSIDDILQAESNQEEKIELSKTLDSISNHNPQTVVDLVTKAVDRIEDPKYLFQLRLSRVRAYIELGKGRMAFREMYTLLHFCRSNKLNQELIDLNVYMVNVLYELGRIPESMRVSKGLLELAKTDSLKAWIHTMIMVTSYKLKDVDESIKQSHRVLEINFDYDSSRYIAYANLYLAKSYISKQQIDSSEKYVKIISDIDESKINDHFRFHSIETKINLKLLKNDTVGIPKYFADLDNLAKRNFQSIQGFMISALKLKYFKTIGNTDSIDFYHNLRNDTFFKNQTNSMKLQLKRIKAEVDEAYLKKEIEESNNVIYYFSFGFAVLIIISISLYVRSYRRKNHVNFLKEILSEKENQEQSLNNELVQKDNDINELASRLIKKNKLLAELELELENEKAKTEIEKEEDIDKFKKELDLSSLNNELYEKLLSISEDFNNTIIKKYPLLSSTELKVCALIKAGFSTKEIASMMYLSYRTIENHRNSIRKKVRLEKDVKLNKFLQSV